MEKFKTTCQGKDGKIYHEDVLGERITIDGIDCFVFEKQYRPKGLYKMLNFCDENDIELNIFNVSHLETGFMLAIELDKEHIIEMTKFRLKKNHNCIEKGVAKAIKLGIKLPVNI